VRRLLPFVLALAPLLAAPASAQTLRIGMNNDPDLLDPTLSRTFVGTVVMTGICDKLVDMDTHLNITPRLATGYEWVDSKTILFRLRPNVLFQDGTKMDAAAVKYSLERDLTFPGSFRKSEIGAVDHIEVVNPLTVQVVLKQPSSPWVAQLTDRSGMIMSPKAAEAEGKNFGLHPVCAGPFSFVERVAQDHITLQRFPQYWDAASIHFERVIYRPMTDSSVRLANLQAGALEIADIVPSDVDAVKRDPKLMIATASSLGYTGITINVGDSAKATTPFGHDSRVRMAFSLSIDRDALNQVVYNGLYTPNAQAVAVGNPLHIDSIEPPKRDIARARALLAEAGVTTPVVVPLMIPNGPQALQVGEVIQSMAREAGFDVQVTAMDFGTTLAAAERGDYSAYLIGWSGLLDADSNVWAFLHTGGPLNYTHYSNPTVDAALDQARAVTDVAQRRALYQQVWQQENQDLPIIYLWTPRNIVGVTAKLIGFQEMPDGVLRLQGVQLTP
jgi:peptide/nickel transport system substrate-binding protein